MTGPAYYVEEGTDSWGNPAWNVMDGFTKTVITSKTTEAAALDAVERLYLYDRNYRGAREAGLDMEDI